MIKKEFQEKVIMEGLGKDCVTNEKDFVNAPFIMGCVLKNGYWNVYKTDERGELIIILKTQNENSAFDKLYERLLRKKRIDDIEK